MMVSFDRGADIYDETRRMPPDMAKHISERIADAGDSSGGFILEMGIGTARIAVPPVERGFRIAGIDISDKMLARLQKDQDAGRHRLRAGCGLFLQSLLVLLASLRVLWSPHGHHPGLWACSRQT